MLKSIEGTIPSHATSHVASRPPLTIAPSPEPFRVLSDLELDDLPDPEWLIDGVLPTGSAAALIAPPASGKSFAAIDVAFHIAAGREWHGRETKVAKVLYVAAEGVRGLKSRVRAWKKARGVTTACNVRFIPEPVQLLDPNEVARLIATAGFEDAQLPTLIIIDTFARCFVGGDENSATAMGQAVEAIRQIQAATGATVLLVHHTRKADGVERGSSALRGALDVMISMRKDGPLVSLSSAKMKDASDFEDIHLRLVEYGPSCILEEAVPSECVEAMDGNAHAVLEMLPIGGFRHGEWKRAANGFGVPSSTFERVRRLLVDAGHVEKGPDSRYIATAAGDARSGATSTRSFRTGTVEPGGDQRRGVSGD
jgi:hypothetical protein